MYCSEPVSSLLSYPGDGVPAHPILAKGRVTADKLPGTERRITALQYLVPCTERRACFPHSNSPGSTPALEGSQQRDYRLPLIIKRTCLAPTVWSEIRNLSHYFHITLAWLQDASHPQSLSWEAKAGSVRFYVVRSRRRG